MNAFVSPFLCNIFFPLLQEGERARGCVVYSHWPGSTHHSLMKKELPQGAPFLLVRKMLGFFSFVFI